MLYIVSVKIDLDRLDEWKTWMLDTHIEDVVNTGCFHGAWMCRDEENDTSNRSAWRFFYLAKGADALKNYQENFAAELQRDHTDRFQGCFEASREILPVEKEFLP